MSQLSPFPVEPGAERIGGALPAPGWGRRVPRVTPERLARTVIAAALLVLVALVVWYFARLFVYLLIGILMAYLLRPAVDRIQGVGVGRVPSILLALVLFFGTISVVVTALLPFVAAQVAELSQRITTETLTEGVMLVETQLRRFLPFLVEPGMLLEGIERGFQTLFQRQSITLAVGSVVGLFTDIFYAVIVIPFVTFFVLKDGNLLRRAVLRPVPNRYYEITLTVVEQVEQIIGRYFRALLVQCLSIALVATLLLQLVGLKYALAVGLFTGVANTIPYFGPLIGLLAGTLVGVTQTGDFSLVPGVLVAMVLTQLGDNLFFQPFLFARASNMHPLVILFAVLIGAQVAGIVGMLVAIPVATIVRIAFGQVLWSLRNYRMLRVA